LRRSLAELCLGNRNLSRPARTLFGPEPSRVLRSCAVFFFCHRCGASFPVGLRRQGRSASGPARWFGRLVSEVPTPDPCKVRLGWWATPQGTAHSPEAAFPNSQVLMFRHSRGTGAAAGGLLADGSRQCLNELRRECHVRPDRSHPRHGPGLCAPEFRGGIDFVTEPAMLSCRKGGAFRAAVEPRKNERSATPNRCLSAPGGREVGFEPKVSCPTHAFQAFFAIFGRSRIPPETGSMRPTREIRLSSGPARSFSQAHPAALRALPIRAASSGNLWTRFTGGPSPAGSPNMAAEGLAHRTAS